MRFCRLVDHSFSIFFHRAHGVVARPHFFCRQARMTNCHVGQKSIRYHWQGILERHPPAPAGWVNVESARRQLSAEESGATVNSVSTTLRPAGLFDPLPS